MRNNQPQHCNVVGRKWKQKYQTPTNLLKHNIHVINEAN